MLVLVVDSNPIISILILKGTKQDILFNEEIKLISLDWVLFEIGKNLKEVETKTRFSKEELELSLSLIRSRIESYSLNEYVNKTDEARKISPHKKDDEFFALALTLDCAIWSDEEAFKKQNKIKVYSSKELAKMLNLPWK